MLHELADESDNQGLKMDNSKKKVMMETDKLIYVNNSQIDNVESFIYLGQRYSIRDKNQVKEIQTRIKAGWIAFAKHRDVFKGNIGICLKRRRGNMGTHHPCNEQTNSRTNKYGKEYVKHHIPGQKPSIWVVSRIRDNRWTLRVTTWKPYERKIPILYIIYII